MVLCVGSSVTLGGDAAGAVVSADGGAKADYSLGTAPRARSRGYLERLRTKREVRVEEKQGESLSRRRAAYYGSKRQGEHSEYD